MINIQGVPLLHEDECNDLCSADNMWFENYFVKPSYTYLPDFSDMDDDDKATYIFKDVKPGMYLVGLEIISDRWVNKGFCSILLNSYGLVLDEGNPMVKKGDNYREEVLMYLSFKHIALHSDFHAIVVPITK